MISREYSDSKLWTAVEHNFVGRNGPVVHMYPELAPIFRPINMDIKEEVCRYIIAYYHPKSPIRMEPDLIARKKIAMDLAGVQTVAFGKYSKEHEEVLMCRNDVINQCIIDYCYLVGSVDFTILAVYEQGLYNELVGLIGKAFTKDTVKKITEIKSEINTLKNDILAGDVYMQELANALYKKTESIRLELRPEDIAQKLSEGKEPVDVYPYGKDYEFELASDPSKLRKV